MKGILVKAFGGPECLEYSDLPEPKPGPTQVLIKVAAASVNYADLKARSGAYHLARSLPLTPGLDLVGTITRIGSAVTRFSVGDRVVAFPATGSYAEIVVAEEKLTFSIPPELATETAAAFPLVSGTAMYMLSEVGRLQEGENVLVHAASGGVGTVALQLAKLLGAARVVATTSSLEKVSYLQQIGADAVLDIPSGAYPNLLSEATGGKGLDLVMNPIGGELIEHDLAHLNDFGRLLIYGKMAPKSSKVSPEALYGENRSIIGFSFGHYRRHRPEVIRQSFEKVIELVSTGRLQLHVERSFALKDAAEAHRLLEDRKSKGKILLIPN